MTTDVEFECPKCGGSSYASQGDQTYKCKGDHRGGCSFRWPASDSWRYFVLVTKVRFVSPEEYDRACRGGS